MYCSTILYCTVLYCTVLYCTVLYCTVLYCTLLLQAVNGIMEEYVKGNSKLQFVNIDTGFIQVSTVVLRISWESKTTPNQYRNEINDYY